MKKLMSLVLVATIALMCLALSGCGSTENTETSKEATPEVMSGESFAAASDLVIDKNADLSKMKIGLICLHDENSTYDNNFIQAMKDAQKELGLKDDQVIIKTNVPEGAECYDTAAELADAGCNFIFADSFGHESYVIKAAKEFKDVQFAHATGTNAQVENLPNYHNAFASIYEGRFLAGVAAGMKLNEMIDAGKIKAEDAVIGYVGAWPYAEVISGYTSFYLGARSICPTATMKVTYTNSWFDIALEREGALALIKAGCVLISQHADSEGAPKACEENNVPNVSYNISTASIAPKTAIIASKINWTPYYEMAITSIAAGKDFAKDWCGTIGTGSVQLTEINEKAAAKGTAEKIEEVKAKIVSGELKVFDTATFTVKEDATIKTNEANFVTADNYKVDADGHLTSYKADVYSDEAFTPDTDVIKDGQFSESSFRSAPYFNVIIDGITLM